jgi:hypothetical protein
VRNQKLHASPQGRVGPALYRTTARIVGVIYWAGMVVGVGGNILVQSILGAPDPLAAVPSNSMLLAVGAVLWLLAGAGDAAHGILMFPVLKPHGERIAVGYLGARIIDAVFVATAALLILVQIPLAGEYLKIGTAGGSSLLALSSVLGQAQLLAYNFGMLTVGCAGLLLNYAFHRARLLPRPLAVWGLVGYATILCGSVLEVLGFRLMDAHTLPGGLWELFVGVWLIARGFTSSPVVSEQTTSPITPIVPAPRAVTATA